MRGTKPGSPVSMCGEMAGEPLYSYVLLGMGTGRAQHERDRDPAGQADPAEGGRVRAKEFVGGAAAALHGGEIGRILRKKMEDLFRPSGFNIYSSMPRSTPSLSTGATIA